MSAPNFGGVSAPNLGGCLLQIFGGVSAPNFRRGVSAPNFRGGVCSKFFGGVSAPNFRGGFLQFSEYGHRSAGMHPTGMHSCYFIILSGIWIRCMYL